jgi:hypothetical protein
MPYVHIVHPGIPEQFGQNGINFTTGHSTGVRNPVVTCSRLDQQWKGVQPRGENCAPVLRTRPGVDKHRPGSFQGSVATGWTIGKEHPLFLTDPKLLQAGTAGSGSRCHFPQYGMAVFGRSKRPADFFGEIVGKTKDVKICHALLRLSEQRTYGRQRYNTTEK